MNDAELLFSVLTVCRTELCRLYPGLSLACGYLPPVLGTDVPLGTDGEHLCVSDALLSRYADDPAWVRRSYLHTLLHCLFLHIDPPEDVDPRRWSLACDILTERQIDALREPRLGTVDEVRRAVLSSLPEVYAPGAVMALLDELPYPAEALERAFRFDDHRLWWTPRSPETTRRWQALQGGGGLFHQGVRGSASPDETDDPVLLKSDPRDYRPLLRKYMVPGEETELDTESFDYIYYDLGMQRYGDLPLLEPLEYREVWRLDELVIAIDTSSSCSSETVSRFLQEVYAIVTSQENFFRRMHLTFFQCDMCLQDTAVIRSREEWLRYMENVKIHGRGGTDFRPVFREIEALRECGEMKKPRALLYFTDGDGAYPTEPPDYETVFILAGDTVHPELLPKWAVIREVL